jgi:glycosyltransferase involved in cell wall biosynthesis
MAMDKSADILVSCLMATLPVAQRFAYLQRAVAAYCEQTHRNKELVLVMDRGEAEAKAAITRYIASLGRADIRIIDPPRKLSLGALRNVSRESARGEILCQWDDDDFHHPERIAVQLAGLQQSGGQALFLEEVIQFFPSSRAAYCINFRATEAKGHPGTLMCWRSAEIRYPESGPDAQGSEDWAVALQLLKQGGLRTLAGSPCLYVYTSHGGNIRTDDHHRMLAEKLSLSQALLRRREAQIREGLRDFDFGPGELVVRGYNGPAFTIE